MLAQRRSGRVARLASRSFPQRDFRPVDIRAAGGAQESHLQNQGEPTTARHVRSKAVVVFGVDVGALF
jgi:hypothetical protein